MTRTYAFVGLVGAGAAASWLVWLVAWHSTAGIDPLMIGLLAGVAVLARRLRTHIAPGTKIDLTAAVLFAAVFLVPVPVALGIAAGSLLASDLYNALTQRRFIPIETAFNLAQCILSLGAGAAVAYAVLPMSAPARLDTGAALLVVPLAALVTHGVNTQLVAAVASISRGAREEPYLRLAARAFVLDPLHVAGLYLAGAVTAYAAGVSPWTVLILLLLAFALHRGIRRVLGTIEDTVNAVEAMADVIDLRDRNTADHSRRVADYATELARAVGLPPNEVSIIRRAARVHDLGKIGLSDDILFKSASLTPAERELIEAHVRIGYEILAKLPEYGTSREVMLTHHERYEGGGYPTGLRAAELPLIHHILPVADALDAMTADRPYRRAMTFEQALEKLTDGAGCQWSPVVIAQAAALQPLYSARIHAERIDPVPSEAAALGKEVAYN